MKIIYQTAYIVVTLGTCFTSATHATTEIQKLIHNPFSRPSFLIIKEDIEVDFSKESEEENIDLRAVIFDGADSMVNLGGTIIKIGQTAQGYKLLSVKEKSVTFLKNNTNITVTLNNR